MLDRRQRRAQARRRGDREDNRQYLARRTLRIPGAFPVPLSAERRDIPPSQGKINDERREKGRRAGNDAPRDERSARAPDIPPGSPEQKHSRPDSGQLLENLHPRADRRASDRRKIPVKHPRHRRERHPEPREPPRKSASHIPEHSLRNEPRPEEKPRRRYPARDERRREASPERPPDPLRSPRGSRKPARPSPEDANVSAKEQTDVISVQSPSPSAPSRDERNAEYATPTARMKSPVAVSTAPSRKNRSFLSVILHTEHIFLCTNDFTVISFAGIILSPVPEPVFRFYKIYFDHRGKMSLSDAPDEILR